MCFRVPLRARTLMARLRVEDYSATRARLCVWGLAGRQAFLTAVMSGHIEVAVLLLDDKRVDSNTANEVRLHTCIHSLHHHRAGAQRCEDRSRM